jgi:hypothetical protein
VRRPTSATTPAASPADVEEVVRDDTTIAKERKAEQ